MQASASVDSGIGITATDLTGFSSATNIAGSAKAAANAGADEMLTFEVDCLSF
jgi:hypothetical protein